MKERYTKRWWLYYNGTYKFSFKMTPGIFDRIDVQNLEGYINNLVNIEKNILNLELDYTYGIGNVDDDFLYSLVTIEIIIRKRI